MACTRTMIGLCVSAAVLALSMGCSSSSSGGAATPATDSGAKADTDATTGGGGDGGGDGATTDAGPSIGSASCADVCAKADAAKCAKDAPGSCMTGCTNSATKTPPACATPWDAFLVCAAGAPWACSAQGAAEPTGCDAQLQAVQSCVASTPADGGSSD